MLHHWQIVVVVRHVVQQPLNQAGCDVLASQGHRLDDGLGALLARHPGHQEQACSHRLRQAAVNRAGAECVRAHSQQHADPGARVARRLEQQLDESGRFFVNRLLGKAEHLFELIDHHQQTRGWRQLAAANSLDQGQ